MKWNIICFVCWDLMRHIVDHVGDISEVNSNWNATPKQFAYVKLLEVQSNYLYDFWNAAFLKSVSGLPNKTCFGNLHVIIWKKEAFHCIVTPKSNEPSNCLCGEWCFMLLNMTKGCLVQLCVTEKFSEASVKRAHEHTGRALQAESSLWSVPDFDHGLWHCTEYRRL